MNLLDQALEAIRAERPAALARGVDLIGVVGSVARRQERPDSDVDVAYDARGTASLLDVGGVLMNLRDALGREVGMVNIGHAQPATRGSLERDLVRA